MAIHRQPESSSLRWLLYAEHDRRPHSHLPPVTQVVATTAQRYGQNADFIDADCFLGYPICRGVYRLHLHGPGSRHLPQ